jgi:hypothetical protein
MGDLKTENTSYPSAIDTATLIANDTDDMVATDINGPVSAIIAMETELGAHVAGSVADLATRLAVMLHVDGGVPRGTSFPVSPPLKPHLFYRSDTDKWYSYNIGTAQYEAIATTSALSEYLRKDIDETVTAQHTFNPTTAKPPFVLGANAADQKVTGLNADKIDGYHAANTTGAVPINNTTVNTDLNADVVDGIHANATATANCLFPLGANKNLALPTPTSGAHTINGIEIATVLSVTGTSSQLYDTAGSYNWTVPANMYWVFVDIQAGGGGGGGGGGGSTSYHGGGGGGGRMGAMVLRRPIKVTPADVIAVVVGAAGSTGAGGAGGSDNGAMGGNGGNGGNSAFGPYVVLGGGGGSGGLMGNDIDPPYTGPGGAAGGAGNTAIYTFADGRTSSSDMVFTGTAGANGTSGGAGGAGGGSGDGCGGAGGAGGSGTGANGTVGVKGYVHIYWK